MSKIPSISVNPFPAKIPPYFCHGLGLGLLWSVLVRGALLANGLLALVALLVLLVCSALVVKPSRR